MKYVHRIQEERLASLLGTFPAVLLVGPRQCGKSTLVRMALPAWRHLDLERAADLSLVGGDPDAFLEANPAAIVIDDAQRLPALFPALRHALDRDGTRRRKGRYVLLGSASPTLVRAVSESLAGRIALLELTPLLPVELTVSRHLAQRWFWGGFPPVLGIRNAAARAEWFSAYVSTFLERDLPALGLSLPARRLRHLWTMLTHVHGSLLNVSDLARSLAVSSHTVAHDLDVLEGAFMIRRLQPFHANIQKRLTKSPKLYIRDSGLLHHLAGLQSAAELTTWNRRGASFEGLVIEQLVAIAQQQLINPEFYFWRTQAGGEVDLLVKAGRKIVPIEIKLGAAVGGYDVAGLRGCLNDLGLGRGLVISGGRERRSLSRSIEIIPWDDVAAGRIDLG